MMQRENMNCKKCHHTDEVHLPIDNMSLLNIGKCLIPSCTCKQFTIPIDKIDEDLL